MNPDSIRWRLGITYALITLLGLTILGNYLADTVHRSSLDQLESRLISEARLSVRALASTWTPDPSPASLDAAAADLAQETGLRITILSTSGEILGESQESPVPNDSGINRPEFQLALEQGAASLIQNDEDGQPETLYAAASIQSDGETVGILRLSSSLDPLQAESIILRKTIRLSTIGIIALTLIVSLVIINAYTRPLRQITQTAAQMAQGNFTSHLPITRKDEIGEIASSLNLLSDQFSQRIGELQAEQVKLRAVLAEMTDGVMILDERGHVVLTNPTAEALFDFGSAESTGQSLVRVLRNHELVELWEKYQESGSEQATFIELDANKFIQAILTSLDDVMVGHTLFHFQDLTRLRHLETVRRDFISNISHELRTPLASLKALADTLQISALDDPESAKHFLGRMDTEIDALAQMVSELLELSRIESGQVPLELIETNPCPIVNNACDRLRVQADRKGINLKIKCSEKLPAILADESRLEQVLVNILHNAIKFTPEKGKITISVDPAGEKLQFAVKDSGVGIPPEDLPRIFERFYKAPNTEKAAGTGLGLSIAKHLVEAHGGRIWAETKVGRGSTFKFTIPVIP